MNVTHYSLTIVFWHNTDFSVSCIYVFPLEIGNDVYIVFWRNFVYRFLGFKYKRFSVRNWLRIYCWNRTNKLNRIWWFGVNMRSIKCLYVLRQKQLHKRYYIKIIRLKHLYFFFFLNNVENNRFKHTNSCSYYIKSKLIVFFLFLLGIF